VRRGVVLTWRRSHLYKSAHHSEHPERSLDHLALQRRSEFARQLRATSTTSCSKGVASMGVYSEQQIELRSTSSKLNTSLNLSPGTYDTVVQEWDIAAEGTYKPRRHSPSMVVEIPSTTCRPAVDERGTANFHRNMTSAPNCGPGSYLVAESGSHFPSLSGKAAKFSIGGTTPYADVL